MGFDQAVKSDRDPNNNSHYLDLYDGVMLMPDGMVYDTGDQAPLEPDKYAFFRTSAGDPVEAHAYGTRSFVGAAYGFSGTSLPWQDAMLNLQAYTLQVGVMGISMGAGLAFGSLAGGAAGALGAGSMISGMAAYGIGFGVGQAAMEYGSGATAGRALSTGIQDGVASAIAGPLVGLAGRLGGAGLRFAAAHPKLAVGAALIAGSGLATPNEAEAFNPFKLRQFIRATRALPHVGQATIVLRPVAGASRAASLQKARALQRLGDKGLLVRGPKVSRDPKLLDNYRNSILSKIQSQYATRNPEFAGRLNARMRTMSPDHVWELQLRGPDVGANLRMLNSRINVDYGFKQIWPQIRSLPEGTRVKIVLQGF